MERLVRGTLIKEEFDSKYAILVDQFSTELDDAKSIFDNQKNDPPLHKNQPPTAGRLKWANELLRRIQEPRQRFNLITNPILESEEAKLVFAKAGFQIDVSNTPFNWFAIQRTRSVRKPM